MSRTQLALGGALVLQLLLILVFRSPFAGATGTVEPRSLLASLQEIDAVRIVLGGSDEEPITLEKSGESWGVTGLGGFPADGEKIASLLRDLEGITVRRPVVTSKRYHETFKVTDEENEGRVRIWSGSEDDPDVDLIVGDAPNYRTTHVRLAGESDVYEARGLTAYDIRSATTNWIVKDLVDVSEEQVVGLLVNNGSGTYELEKRDGAWTVVAPADTTERQIDSRKVENLVRSMTTLRLADAVGPREPEAQGLASPAATVVLRWTTDGAGATGDESPADPRELTIEIGAQVEDNESQRFVSRSGFGYTGSVWESSVESVLEGGIDDLMGS
jgi:hypothetical protein